MKLFLIGYLIDGLIFGIICRYIVKNKGYDDYENYGFFWGFFLGFIGLIVCAVKPDQNIYSNNRTSGQNSSGLNYDYNKSSAPKDSAGWVCNCGTRNYGYETNCHNCGKPKFKSAPVENTKPRIEIEKPRSVKSDEMSISDQIKEINKLKEEGFITEEEYEAKKKQILGI